MATTPKVLLMVQKSGKPVHVVDIPSIRRVLAPSQAVIAGFLPSTVSSIQLLYAKSGWCEPPPTKLVGKFVGKYTVRPMDGMGIGFY